MNSLSVLGDDVVANLEANTGINEVEHKVEFTGAKSSGNLGVQFGGIYWRKIGGNYGGAYCCDIYWSKNGGKQGDNDDGAGASTVTKGGGNGGGKGEGGLGSRQGGKTRWHVRWHIPWHIQWHLREPVR